MKTKYAHLIETGKPAKVTLTGYSSRPVNALAGIPLGLLHPSGKSTVRSARTHAPALRVCVQIALGRPSVAGTPADKRFGSRASDISKINFNGARQTRSTPHDYAVMVASRSGSGSPQLGRRMSSLTSMALRAMPTPPGIECSWRGTINTVGRRARLPKVMGSNSIAACLRRLFELPPHGGKFRFTSLTPREPQAGAARIGAPCGALAGLAPRRYTVRLRAAAAVAPIV
jgi:hypothetical protein